MNNPSGCTYEAGFLGPWGEWHTSGPNGLINHKLLSEKLNRNEIVGELRKRIHSEIPILLRKPVFKGYANLVIFKGYEEPYEARVSRTILV